MISIIIPYFKTEKYIKNCVKSVLSQSYKYWEVIIIDDENSLQSRKLLSQFKNKKIKIIKNKSNIGVAKSRNKGIDLARGEYISFLDSDDRWHKDKLKKQIDYIKKNKVDAVYSSYKAFSKNKFLYKVVSSKILNYKELIKANPICCSSVMVAKKILLNNKFRNLKTKEDYELWLRISKKHNIYPMKNYLTYYEVRENSLSSLEFNKLYNAYKIFRIYNDYKVFTSVYFVIRLYINAIIKKFFSIKP